jgi:hypothetical protein
MSRDHGPILDVAEALGTRGKHAEMVMLHANCIAGEGNTPESCSATRDMRQVAIAMIKGALREES